MRRRVNRLIGGCRTVHWDSFTDPAGTPVLMHASDSGSPYIPTVPVADPTTAAVIDSTGGRLAEQAAIHATVGTIKARSWRRSGSVSADVIKIGIVADNSIIGVLAHAGLGGRSYVIARQNHTGALWQLTRRTFDQGELSLATSAQALTVDQTYRLRLELRGAVALVWVDNALIMRADAGRLQRGGAWGWRDDNAVASAPQVRLDNWMTTR